MLNPNLGQNVLDIVLDHIESRLGTAVEPQCEYIPLYAFPQDSVQILHGSLRRRYDRVIDDEVAVGIDKLRHWHFDPVLCTKNPSVDEARRVFRVGLKILSHPVVHENLTVATDIHNTLRHVDAVSDNVLVAVNIMDPVVNKRVETNSQAEVIGSGTPST